MSSLQKTIFHARHKELGAVMVDFGGWEMPVNYPHGVLREHLACRKHAGLFDVSHMGRFAIGGTDAPAFLQRLLTNNVEALEVGESQYTILSDENGSALDDAYLYRFVADRYLLVVNASNRAKDWRHVVGQTELFADVGVEDLSDSLAMLSLQGPHSKRILQAVITSGQLPMPQRNKLGQAEIAGTTVWLARTGYTGDPLGFELFIKKDDALAVWDQLLSQGAEPIGLGARDTLRLEAALPLYGHEFGLDAQQKPIPIFACSLARFAVSFSERKGAFIGREALQEQFAALQRIVDHDYTDVDVLPRLIVPVAVTGKGIARQGCTVYRRDRHVGFITSGTMVPFWTTEGEGLGSTFSEHVQKRAIALALLDADIVIGDALEIDIRGRKTSGVVVPYHMRAEAPPLARAIMWDRLGREIDPAGDTAEERQENRREQAEAMMIALVRRSLDNSIWRQRECINLIPSEQTPSTLAKLLSVMDPVGRYAEHKKIKAFHDADIFYYQGTEFIRSVEEMLVKEMRAYLGCRQVESRIISGQLANMAVFSGLVDHVNRVDRKREQRRIRKVMNNHIMNGGHLSAQPMGALRDYLARDPKTEKPAAVNFPVHQDNPYKIDVEACRRLLEIHRPELIIFGKSMTIYPEPVAPIRQMVDELGLDTVVMYDMAHVLGLVGPYFQEPFKDGADLVTGSTHKTYFGTQRGIIAGNYLPDDRRYPLWEAVERRTFPGSVSNHHLGTLLGLLASAYELNYFKNEYQRQVIANARAFALALADLGLSVAGDRDDGFTHTHQVIVQVGYARGPEVADILEKNNIIVNYQATSEEEGFAASGALRMGVAEMTRFGMEEAQFRQLAQLIHDVVKNGGKVKQQVVELRKDFTDLHYCFDQSTELSALMAQLHRLV